MSPRSAKASVIAVIVFAERRFGKLIVASGGHRWWRRTC